MIRSRSLAALLALASLLPAGPASGEAPAGVRRGGDDPGAEDALERGRELVRAFEFEAATRQLERVAGDDAAPPSQRVEALELLGALHHNRRRPARARRAFERLLAIDPGHSILDPDIPPRVREFLSEVRAATEVAPSATLEVRAPAAVPPAGGVRIEATVGGQAAGLEQMLAFVRRDSDGAFTRVAMDRLEGLEFAADLARPPPGTGLRYFVEAQAPSGHVLARAGSLEEPRRVEPAPGDSTEGVWLDVEEPPAREGHRREGPAWHSTWWFWTIVGVVVVGGAATGLALGLPPSHEDGSLGSVRMP